MSQNRDGVLHFGNSGLKPKQRGKLNTAHIEERNMMMAFTLFSSGWSPGHKMEEWDTSII